MADSVHPAHTPEREAFRQRFALRPLTSEEEGANLHHLPEGIYGYTTSAGADEIPVFNKPVFQCFEIHKAAGGDVSYVGYLSEKEYSAVQNGAEAVTVSLYPEPYGDATRLLSVPLSRIDRIKPPVRDQGNWMKLEIAAKGQFLGVSGRAN